MLRRGYSVGMSDKPRTSRQTGQSADGALTILVSCVGRRVELLQAFRAAAERLGIDLRLIGTDTSATAPALNCTDVPTLVPPIADPDYIPTLLRLVREHRVSALLPTIDTDLPVLSRHRAEFEQAGCLPLVASPDVIDICRDKLRTCEFFHNNDIDSPATYTAEQIRALPERHFPYFIKPRYGSASQFVHRLENERDLEYHLERTPEPIVQEFVSGLEYTLDVYVGLSGTPRCVVPRARWQVRTGEVTKGVVVKDRKIMEAGRAVVSALGTSVRGLVTLQCIVTDDHRVRFIEINPRFGGGAPLGIAAGADYPAWLMQELLGRQPQVEFDGFRHGLLMLRYDWSCFVPLRDDLTPRIIRPLKDYPRW